MCNETNDKIRSSSPSSLMTIMTAKSNNITLSLCLFISIIIFSFGIAHGEICRQILPNSSKIEVFECPRLFESRIKSWCCQSNTLHPTCCPWNERMREAEPQRLTLSTIIVNLLWIIFTCIIILFILYCCCIHNKNRKFNQQQQQQNIDYCPHHLHQSHHPDPSCPPVSSLHNQNNNVNNDQTIPILDPPPPYESIVNNNNNSSSSNNNNESAATIPSSTFLTINTNVPFQQQSSIIDDNGQTTTATIQEHNRQSPYNPEFFK
uniref:Uncharacterized protein LOC113798801 n=1 Tax=Dermatophagoides pteronyssinus TaxID=6956 RepID=A0A6P6YIX4_DERPT|nr:uncharacterized protein LOC113798801 [Dermatophagoides pteronyssinus]